MIFDDATLNILKNFSTINPGILVMPGNVITTVNKGESVFARAIVSNDFTSQFAIAELSKFLAALSIFTKPEVEFTDKYIVIKNASGTNKINYTMASPAAILAKPDSKIVVKEIEAEFVLSLEMYQQMIKAISVLSSDEVVFYAENDKMMIKSHNLKNPSENIYTMEVGEIDKPFHGQYRIDVENMNLIPSEYKIKIDKRGFVNFSKENLDYFIKRKV